VHSSPISDAAATDWPHNFSTLVAQFNLDLVGHGLFRALCPFARLTFLQCAMVVLLVVLTLANITKSLIPQRN
jgi:hypothetical protein